ncbi:MAG: S-layer protein, partial [Bacillota bacterium]|nr:S-layer protein [Bacillota bacterium]
MKKKAIKIAAASAVAASAFVAAAPHQTSAASNVSTEVSKAVTQMQKAYHTYSDVTATGQFADLAVVYKEYNAAKVAYNNAKALVVKAGGAQKDAYLAQLDVNYNELIAKRVVTYIDAYQYATTLGSLKTQLDAALTAKDWDQATALYHKISYELKTRTVILDRVYGVTTRELLRSQFKATAQTLRDSLVEEVTVKMYVDLANAKLAAKDYDGAKAAIAVVDANLPKVDKNSEFGKALVDAATKVKADYDATQVTKVASVTAIDTNKVEVKFDKAVDPTKVSAALKVGAASLYTTSKFADDNKSVVLTTPSAIAAGDYSVVVTGIDKDPVVTPLTVVAA